MISKAISSAPARLRGGVMYPELYSWETYKDPLTGGKRLRGIIKNDPRGRWPDGTRVFTSLVKSMKNGFAITENTVYQLGGKWDRSWTHRTLEDKIKTEDGPVHFNIVRW